MVTAALQQESTWDKLFEAFEPAVSKLTAMAIGAATGVLGKMVLDVAPEAMRKDLREVIENVTTRLGGTRPYDFSQEEAGAPGGG
jgi:hypothetical protein